MAGKEEEGEHRVDLRIDKDSQLGDVFEDWLGNFENKSAAARQAMRRGLLENRGDDGGWSLSGWAAAALSASALGIVVGQAAIVFDAVVAGGLAAVAMLTVAGVMLLPDDSRVAALFRRVFRPNRS